MICLRLLDLFKILHESMPEFIQGSRDLIDALDHINQLILGKCHGATLLTAPGIPHTFPASSYPNVAHFDGNRMNAFLE
jgi:hypothetical protein